MLGLFFLSRLGFANWGEVFFDSGEYLTRWANPNLMEAITQGHPPLHSGYVLTFWPIFQLAKLLRLDPGMTVIVFQIILAGMTVVMLYKWLTKIVGKEKATIASITFSLLPIYWICNETVMMETTYIFYFVASLYFLEKYLTDIGEKNANLIWSGVAWAMAFLTHTVLIMWIPLVLFYAYSRNKLKFPTVIFYGAITLISVSIINAYWLAISLHSNLSGGFYWLYAAKFGEHAQVGNIIITVGRYLRNWILPLGYNFGWSLLALAVIGLIILWKRNRNHFWLMLLWLAPTIITNQWWDSLLYGRHSLIAGIAVAYLANYWLSKKSVLLLWGLMLIIAVPKLALLRLPIPYLETATAISELPPGGLMIESHFARPQTEEKFAGETVFVDEPGWDKTDIINKINIYLKARLNVFVTAQALSEPYGLFSGPYLHPLSLSYRKDTILGEKLSGYKLWLVKLVDLQNNLAIYQITRGEAGDINIYQFGNHPRRLDQFDPMFQIFSYSLGRIGRNL